ncbi:MAG TPA: response regulator [Stellaceae bacterium]|nr:response regulator [Stellaceae bacterium]
MRGVSEVTPKHVLVVDDDPAILDVVQRALASEGVRVSTARRVSLARDVLNRQTVDLVITDARIPGETGMSLAQAAGERGIAAIVMSGDIEWATEHGIAPEQYLAKPFDLGHLQRLVERYLKEGEAGSPPSTLTSPAGGSR